MKNFRSTLIALVIFTVLLTVFYFLKLAKDRKEASQEAKLQMLHLEPREVISFSIMTPLQKISIGRIQESQDKSNELFGEWEITDPAHVPVAQSEVKYLLENLPGLKAKRFVSADAKGIADFGLKTGFSRISVETSASSKEIMLGKRSILGEEYYAKVADEPAIYLIERPLVDRLLRGFESFRERKIMDFDPKKSDFFEIETLQRKWSVSKITADKGPAKWMISQGQKQQEADENAILSLLIGIRDLRVDTFLADHITSKEVEQYGLTNPALRFTVREESGKQDGLWLSKSMVQSRNEQVSVMKPAGRFIYGLNGHFLEKLSADPVTFEKTQSQTEGKTDGP